MKITKEHINSILFGVAVGDALGVPVEFQKRAYLEENPVKDMIGFGTYNQPKGTWSDDSTMTFCLAESLALEPFDLRDLANRFINWVDFGYWTPYGELFDIGSTTYRAIERLRTIDPPETAGGNQETDNGNGSLMRILPLILETNNLGNIDSFKLVNRVSSLTHRHIRSVISCFYYLQYSKNIIAGKSKFESYDLTNRSVSVTLHEIGIEKREIEYLNKLLDGKLHEEPEQNIKGSGYVLHSLEASIWCLLTTESYKKAVLKAINLGEDTDTTGAITGGIAALYYGFESIPENWIQTIAKNNEIEKLGNKLAEKYTKK